MLINFYLFFLEQAVVYNIRSSTVLKMYRLGYDRVMQMFMEDDQAYRDLRNFTQAAQKSMVLNSYQWRCQIYSKFFIQGFA